MTLLFDPYLAAFIVGAGGLTTMGLAGSFGHSHAGHGGHLSHAGHADLAHVHAGHAGHAGHGVDLHAQHHHLGLRPARGSRWLSLMSPRVLFSLAMGIGATGLIARGWTGGVVLLAIAVLGGVVLEAGIVGPLWNLLFRFAGEPAQTLDTVLFDTARVVTAFDASGCGLVELTLDGQLRQVLAQLPPAERSGPRLRAGDTVRIEAVDTARQRLTVSRAAL